MSLDLNNPTVRVYYGLVDGGFDQGDWNNTYVDVNFGAPVPLGDFNTTISGLNPVLPIISCICREC